MPYKFKFLGWAWHWDFPEVFVCSYWNKLCASWMLKMGKKSPDNLHSCISTRYYGLTQVVPGIHHLRTYRFKRELVVTAFTWPLGQQSFWTWVQKYHIRNIHINSPLPIFIVFQFPLMHPSLMLTDILLTHIFSDSFILTFLFKSAILLG